MKLIFIPKREKQEPCHVLRRRRRFAAKSSSHTGRGAPGWRRGAPSLRRGTPGRRGAQRLRKHIKTSTGVVHQCGATHLSFKPRIHPNDLITFAKLQIFQTSSFQVSGNSHIAIARDFLLFHSV